MTDTPPIDLVAVERWRRIAAVDLQALCGELSSAAMATLKRWPDTGEGRELKAACERSIKRLSGLSDKHVADAFRLLSMVIDDLTKASSSDFFLENIAGRKIKSGNYRGLILGIELQSYLEATRAYIEKYRPYLPEKSAVTEISDAGDAKLGPEVSFLDSFAYKQRPGPLQYEVVNGVLKTKSQSPSQARVPQSAEAARVHLIEEAEKILLSLLQSNIDQRSVAIVEDVKRHLVSKDNIVRVGITNIALEGVLQNLQEIASEPLTARVKSLYVGVKLYVGQFEEWHSFVDNAAEADVTPEAVRDAKSVAQNLVRDLKANPGLAEPDVPLSIEILLEAFRSPRTSVRRLTYALVRSIENICASIFSAALEIKNNALEGAALGTKRAVGVVVGTGLLAIALPAAISISPTVSKVLDTDWMKIAARSIMKELGGVD